MIKIKHKFLDHQINPETETLIIGTFNPKTKKNEADFFYGRSKNYFWQLLPTAVIGKDLKNASKEEKLDFIKKYKIDLVDLIEEVNVEEGKEDDYNDKYIDDKVTRWKNIIKIIDTLPKLKKVGFTRKSDSDIPNMRKRIVEIKKHCDDKNILFKALITPSRPPDYYKNQNSQTEWTNFFKC